MPSPRAQAMADAIANRAAAREAAEAPSPFTVVASGWVEIDLDDPAMDDFDLNDLARGENR